MAVSSVPVFLGVSAAAAAVASKSFKGTQADGANATTYSGWSSVSCSASDTRAVIGIVGGAGGTARSVSSVTITGNVSGAQTGVAAADPGSTDPHCAIWTAPLVNDTSFTISITFSGGSVRAGIAVWTTQGMATTPSATSTADTTNPFSATITTPANGLGFAVTFNSNSSSPTISWTTYTKDGSDQAMEGSRRMGAASIAGADSTGPTATYSSSTSGRIAVATFAPA